MTHSIKTVWLIMGAMSFNCGMVHASDIAMLKAPIVTPNKTIEEVQLKLNLKNIRIEPESYNWEYDTFYTVENNDNQIDYNGSESYISFEIDPTGIEEDNGQLYYCEVAMSPEWMYEMIDPECGYPYPFYIDLEYDPYTKRYYVAEADWGCSFVINAYTRDSPNPVAKSDIYFTTDYITDPEVRDRINYLSTITSDVPDNPVCENISFEIEEYDWENDTMAPDSRISFNIVGENAAQYDFYIYEIDKQSSASSLKSIRRIYVPHTTKKAIIDVDWNQEIRVMANNFGFKSELSEPIRVADFITDPEIRKRVDTLMGTVSGIGDVSENEIELCIVDGNLQLNRSVESVQISDAQGRLILFIDNPDGTVSLSNVNTGIYIIHAIGKAGCVKTIKYLKK